MNVNRSTGIQHVYCTLNIIAAHFNSHCGVPFIASFLIRPVL